MIKEHKEELKGPLSLEEVVLRCYCSFGGGELSMWRSEHTLRKTARSFHYVSSGD